MWLNEIAHEGNTNASEEEVEEVAGIVADLLSDGVEHIDQDGLRHPMPPADIIGAF